MSLPPSAPRSVGSPGGAPPAHLWRYRAVWLPFMRIVSAMLAVLVASSVLGLNAASAAPSAAKSSYEQAFNPFGDDWSTKTAPNTSIAVGLTPACYKRNPKILPVEPPLPPLNAEEAAFIAKSNTPMIWEECADVQDASGPDGFGRIGDIWIKRNIEQQKAANPALKYVGYLPMTRADTQTIGQGVATVGLKYIHANREDWFVHTAAGARVKYNQSPGGSPSDLFDITNREFRAFMVARIVESMNYHGMDGFVMDQCFDIPMVDNGQNVVPSAIYNNWGQSCINMLAELKAALNPLGKKVFFTGFFHYSSGGNDTIEEDFYFRRIDASNGIYWEDPFKAVTASDSLQRSSTDRLLRLQEYALARGAHFVNTVNTAYENQSSFGSTSYEQQQALARFYLAAFLISADTRVGDPAWGPLRVMYHYTPISSGPQFYSAAYFRDWDIPVGAPTGPVQTPVGNAPVYMREFAGGRIVFNAGSSGYTVDLSSSGPWTTVNGDALPSSFTVPAKSGITLRKPLPVPVVCSPRPAVTVSVTKLSESQQQAVLTAGSTAGNISKVQVLSTKNATVSIDGGPSNASGAFTFTPTTSTTTVRIILNRVAPGTMIVPMTVTDGCGDWHTFAGSGG